MTPRGADASLGGDSDGSEDAAGGAELHAVVPNPTAISAAKNVHLFSFMSPAPERR
jgi:hypothetical protein